MFHVKRHQSNASDGAYLKERLSFLSWDRDDVRWQGLSHFLERVKSAGLALVSKADRDRLIERHLIPSLEALDMLPREGRILDVGSGGGFPVLPLALMRPDLKFVAVESNERKSAFLARVSREIGTANVEMICSRVEALSADHNRVYQMITSRATADVATIVDWTRRLLAAGGGWLLWKGRDWRQEADLGRLRLEVIVERELSDGGRLVFLRSKDKEQE